MAATLYDFASIKQRLQAEFYRQNQVDVLVREFAHIHQRLDGLYEVVSELAHSMEILAAAMERLDGRVDSIEQRVDKLEAGQREIIALIRDAQ